MADARPENARLRGVNKNVDGRAYLPGPDHRGELDISQETVDHVLLGVLPVGLANNEASGQEDVEAQRAGPVGAK